LIGANARDVPFVSLLVVAATLFGRERGREMAIVDCGVRRGELLSQGLRPVCRETAVTLRSWTAGEKRRSLLPLHPCRTQKEREPRVGRGGKVCPADPERPQKGWS